MLELDAREALCRDEPPTVVMATLVQRRAAPAVAREIVDRIAGERHAIYRLRGGLCAGLGAGRVAPNRTSDRNRYRRRRPSAGFVPA